MKPGAQPDGSWLLVENPTPSYGEEKPPPEPEPLADALQEGGDAGTDSSDQMEGSR